jgi:hypothetical protein
MNNLLKCCQCERSFRDFVYDFYLLSFTANADDDTMKQILLLNMDKRYRPVTINILRADDNDTLSEDNFGQYAHRIQQEVKLYNSTIGSSSTSHVLPTILSTLCHLTSCPRNMLPAMTPFPQAALFYLTN